MVGSSHHICATTASVYIAGRSLLQVSGFVVGVIDDYFPPRVECRVPSKYHEHQSIELKLLVKKRMFPDRSGVFSKSPSPLDCGDGPIALAIAYHDLGEVSINSFDQQLSKLQPIPGTAGFNWLHI